METIIQNLTNAFRKLLVFRVVVSSPNKKILDIPAFYALLALLLAPKTVIILVILGFIFHYSARIEKDAYLAE